MITPDNIERLNKIVAYYVMKDYKQANPKPAYDRKGNPKRKSYSLSEFSLEAHQMLHDAVNGKNEEQVKAYLLRQKMLFDL